MGFWSLITHHLSDNEDPVPGDGAQTAQYTMGCPVVKTLSGGILGLCVGGREYIRGQEV